MDIEIIEKRVIPVKDSKILIDTTKVEFELLKRFNSTEPLPLIGHLIQFNGIEYIIENIAHILQTASYDFQSVQLILKKI